jgi:glyoxylase-like metal-dependent hydrolase (beta-lactamase superfamily II)
MASQGIAMLELSAVVMGRTETVCPAMVWDDDGIVLIDTGYPGQYPLLKRAIEAEGFSVDRLTNIIITHQDIDHIGSLATILKNGPDGINVIASELEKPYIQGDRMLLKVTPERIASALRSMPEGVPVEWKEAFKRTLENPPKAPVDRLVADGEELPFGGGLTVIETPGHTPGHISLYHRPSKTLIAADAMNVAGGELLGPDPEHAVDPGLAVRSLTKFAAFDIERVICYHGGMYRGDCNRRIAELAAV